MQKSYGLVQRSVTAYCSRPSSPSRRACRRCRLPNCSFDVSGDLLRLLRRKRLLKWHAFVVAALRKLGGKPLGLQLARTQLLLHLHTRNADDALAERGCAVGVPCARGSGLKHGVGVHKVQRLLIFHAHALLHERLRFRVENGSGQQRELVLLHIVG